MKDLKETKKSQKLITIIVAVLAVLLIALSSYFIATNNKKETKEEDKETKEESKEESKKEQITPLMYKVTKNGSDNVIYLFGSMHLVNLKEFDFPKYVLDAYENSDYLAVEADIIAVQQQKDFATNYLLSSMYSDGTTIKNHISESTYNKLVKFLEEHYMYNEQLDIYKASFFESIISNIIVQEAGINSEDGVDTFFLKKAKKENKNVLEVESYEFQENLLNSFPDRLYELSIISAIDNFDAQVKEMQRLYKIWKNGNEEELVELIKEDSLDTIEGITAEDKKLINNYNYEVVDKRNIGMKEKFNSYFNNNQKVLFMVGAAHIVGENGLANLLKQEGYTITAINR